jgi:DNA repair protein RecN (Recombination protein N)
VLEQMRIRGLGVIEDAVLDLSPGFTAVTGETGAGKTMVVSGLDLLFGGRAETTRIRPGADRATVEGRLLLAADSSVARRAEEAGAAVDPAGTDEAGRERVELLLGRVIGQSGQGRDGQSQAQAQAGSGAAVRSRAHLGGQAVPVSVIADLGEELIAMHGQSAQQRLLQPARQRAALDRYAGEAVSRPLAAYRAAYQEYRSVAAQLEELTTQARERLQEADALRYGLSEIEKVEPVAGELEELIAEAQRLGNAESLRSAASTAHEALVASDDTGPARDAASLVNAARRAVDQAKGDDAALGPIATRLEELYWLLTETATDLAGYLAGIEADPVRLEVVHERISDLENLCRRYGPTVEDVLAWAERGVLRLAELDGDDDRIESLTARRDELRAQLAGYAGEVSGARAAAAEKFAAAVTTELTELAMPHARIAVNVAQRVIAADAAPVATGGDASALPVPDPDTGAERLVAFGPNGVDDVELRLAPHPGAPLLPIGKGASGGELSRVMLAVEVVFAGADPVPTFVFDEVDAGVGGKAAVEVGRRLARLARTAQVIVVTHLPQVAAFADRQLLVRKENDGSVTSSGVVVLDEAQRRRELARMLSGLEDSELGQAHADELLAAAHAERG